MRLPKDLLTGTMTKPRLFLCETNKERICELETISMSGSFKFNAYSELTFTVGRTYTNMITGETQVNPFYDKIEALRLVYLESFGYFEIQDPEIVSDGIKEVKNVTAYGLEYTLSQKYLENFKVNTGEVDSIEVMHAKGGLVTPVTLYNEAEPGLSLLDLALEKIYGWKIGHIDQSLYAATTGRTFDISRTSIYDFLIQDLCDKFNCFIIFDTINNTINLYAESLSIKHMGDGETKTFTVSPGYPAPLGAVSVNGSKITAYTYEVKEEPKNKFTGFLTFNKAPGKGEIIEITDGSQTNWTTDVYVSFDNLAQEVNISYSADDIKTVLTVKGADDLDIREVNMGLPYLVDISYYYNVDWMGKELYDAYTTYLKDCNATRDEYVITAREILKLQNDISFEENRVSLGYGVDSSVNAETVGTYYIIDGGSYPNYTYKEVSLPSDYNANLTYYKLNGVNITEEKVHSLYSAVRKYFIETHGQVAPEIKDIATRDQTWQELLEELTDQFEFVSTKFAEFKSLLNSKASVEDITNAFKSFLDMILDEMGYFPLNDLFLKPYQGIKSVCVESKWNVESSEYYWFYYPVQIMLDSLDNEIKARKDKIDILNTQLEDLKKINSGRTDDISIYNYFTPNQIVRLSSFLREDEYTDDNFVKTEIDTIDTLMTTKQELLECGRIELSKLCEPKLAFTMDMANIYALPEFEPIIDQFQLGNLINVVIRKDYIKRARLLAVEINFDDFSDFSCEFGELTNLRTQSSIHADLLASALSAGKSVASNASYWSKGSDAATSLSMLIKQGLLDAATTIKAIDGTQGVSIDKYGIHLQKIDPTTGAIDPKEGWIINNQFLYSDDNFKTTRSVFGEYTIDGRTHWGLLAEAVMAGYLAGCTIEGGTIDIGEGTFVVDSGGNVTMKAASINGYVEENGVISSINQSPEQIAINANRISLAGKAIDLTSDNITIDSTNFSVTKDGKITATSGEIAGWTIKPEALVKNLTVDKTDYQMYLQSPNSTSLVNAFAVRTKATNSDDWDIQFSVGYTGKLTAKNADITGAITANSLTLGSGVTIPYSKLSGTPDLDVYIAKDGTIGSTPSEGSTGFKVSSSGLLTASNAVIYGTVYASDGKIAGWTIDSNSIRYGTLGGGASMWLVRSGSTSSASIGGSDEISGWCIGVSNTFGVTKNGKLYATGADISGKITASSGSIGSWTIGNMENYTNSLYATYCASSTPSNSSPEYAVFMRGTGEADNIAIGVKKRTSSSTAWVDAENPFYVRKDGYVKMSNANVTGTINAESGEIGGCKINDGVLNISAANITSGIIANARIPNLNADKITAGTLDVDRIPNISASKITSGTISTSRLDASVITTGNFSSKTLSSGNISVTNGGNIGAWSVTSSGSLYAISGDVGVGLSAYGLSAGSGGSTSWVSILMAGQNASDKRLKKNISEFDDKLDNIFDSLKPVQFEYSTNNLSKGIHFGYLAQDVIKSFADNGEDIQDYSFVYETAIEDNLEETYYQLNKAEFIALNTWQIQKLKNKVMELENRLAALEK